MTDLLKPMTSGWNRDKARHLSNRAGFGVPVQDADALAGMSLEAAVARFIDYETLPQNLTEPDWLPDPKEYRNIGRKIEALRQLNGMGSKKELTAERRETMEAEERKLRNMFNAEERRSIERLKRWWLARMLTTKRPLEEKMALFWHGHFAASAEKVKASRHNYEMNKLFRDMATGNFKMLTYEVGVSPAMLRYLDNAQSSKFHPNENWARELMELFTLGEGHYTEQDIKESARAFTGWTSDGEEFVFNPNNHDNGEKTFLGRKGPLNGNDIIDTIFEREQASRFICKKLWKYFAYDNPEDEVIEGMAATLRNSGYDLKPALRQMFLSQAFYSDKAMANCIKSPAQLTVSMLGALNVAPPKDSMVEQYLVLSMRAMGQDLFFPPNVKGWEGGRTWINTNTLMTRYGLANFLAQGVAMNIGPGTNILQRSLEKQKKLAERKSGAKKPTTRAEVAREAMRAKLGEAAAMEPDMDNEMGVNMEMEGEMEGMGGGEMNFEQVGVVGDANGPKGFRMPFAPFDPKPFFAKADGMKVGEIVDFMADYFYGRPFGPTQRAETLEALGAGENAIFKIDQWDAERLRGAVRLALSAAEFQVC